MEDQPEQKQLDSEYIDELTHLLTLAKNPRTRDLLESALKKARSPDEEPAKPTPQVNGAHTSSEAVKKTPTDALPEPVQVSAVKQPRSGIKINEYGWDQSDKNVKIYITSLAGLDELTLDSISSDIGEKSMRVELKGVKGKNYYLLIDDLCAKIVPDQSSVKARHGVVTVTLRKTTKEHWPFLTAREKRLKDAREVKPPKSEADEDPGAGLMKLMKQMYNEGDDEMKRTIAKSWYESQEKRKQGLEDFPL